MSLMFYPHTEDVEAGSLQERVESLKEAAERYKAAILDSPSAGADSGVEARYPTPKDLTVAYNWDAIAIALREVRALPEGSQEAKTIKSRYLNKLADIYEVLRGAKMPKLEAVRLAIKTEAEQLGGGGSAKVS